MTIKELVQRHENKNKYLIDELSKMSPMVLEIAYLYAINYASYGEDVTEKWVTATQQAAILEKVYRKGYYEALQEIGGKRMSFTTNHWFEDEPAEITRGELGQMEESFRAEGRNEAWEIARKMIKYGMIKTIDECSVKEAMAKIKEYESQMSKK